MAIDDRQAEVSERFLSARRIRNIIIGAVVALILGVLISFAYTSIEYGGSPLDSIFGSKKVNPAIGKLAYDKNTHYFIGVIKSEGYSVKRAAPVFYIERAGGGLIEYPKDVVEIRAPQQQP
ncbi:MAG TPA: hypothetical protein VLZ81_14970 [Blastocatellia bacterium]|nr:hypothetical protein [Blastocatellia bacterium]